MIKACKLAVPHLRAAERPPLLAVAVPGFGIYREDSNRKLPTDVMRSNQCQEDLLKVAVKPFIMRKHEAKILEDNY